MIIYKIAGTYIGLMKIKNTQGGYYASAKSRKDLIDKIFRIATNNK